MCRRKANSKKADVRIYKKLRKGDIFIDCGANTGQEIDIVFKTGVTVHAFEPNPHAFAVLLQKYAQYPQIHLYNQAVHDHSGETRLYLHIQSDEDEIKWSTGSSLLDFKGNVSTDKYVEIEVIDLIEFVEGLGQNVKLLKIDVEGVEAPIINALIDRGTIKKIEMVVAETHEEKIPEIRDDIQALKERIKREDLGNIRLDWI